MRPEPFHQIIHTIRKQLLDGHIVDRDEWQSLRDKRPQMQVLETYNVVFTVEVPSNFLEWGVSIQPNLPWAEDHFQERVSGKPLNPGVQYKNWPWYEQGVEEHKETGEFSHTYMERFWAKLSMKNPIGVRFGIGDLEDLVAILQERPWTRQAYLPIWFPEDLWASRWGERVPCTLGYHFQARPDPVAGTTLDMFYPMRSCDYYRYLRDDVYMAGRLLQWVAGQVDMAVGRLTMHIANLHVFSGEHARLDREHKEETARRLSGAF